MSSPISTTSPPRTVDERPETPSTPWGPAGYPYRWIVFACVLAADVMDLLDSTIVNLAGPSIRRDIGGGESTLQWILAAYTLAFAIGLVTSGRLGDIVGRRRMFLTGMVGFTAMSLACGLTLSPEWLITARALQGLFGAVMIPQGLAYIKSCFPPADLAKAFTVFGPVMGLSAVLGPIIAGVLLHADLFGTGWRMIFLINLPIGIVMASLAMRFMPEMKSPNVNVRLDLGGSALLTIASAMLIYPLVQGHELGWPGWLIAMMIGSAVVFVLFALNERRSAHPVIEPGLFRKRSFVAGLLVIFSFFVAMVGFSLVFNLFVQIGLRYDALHTGLVFAPWAFGIAVGATISGAVLAEKLGRHVVHIGIAIATAGMVWLWWTIHHNAMATTGWDVAWPTLLAGVGGGLIFAPLFDIILADVSDEEVGTGAGLLNAVQQFSGAAGVALLGTVFFELLPKHMFAGATEWIIWMSVAAYAVTFAVAFMLPKRAREGAGAF
jgi:EmrB/QacA subfamily drug resistance transporter